MNILPGDVLVQYGNVFFNKIIEQVTHGPSHVALFLTPTILEEAQAGRKAGEIDLSFFTDGNARLEVWGDPALTDAERAEMVSYAHQLYGTKYDYVLMPLELLHFELGLPLGWYHNTDALICSNDVDKIAQHVGRHWSQVPNPAPVDLITGGVLVKKGELHSKQEITA